MKIAIHHRKGSFSDYWIKYCDKKHIEYKIVNAFDSNIIEQLQGYNIFMWHHHHANYKDVIGAKKILFSVEQSGIKVFPDFKTGWHFDDKVAQKYLLEAIGASLVPSYVFYDKNSALSWLKNIDYPKVFKLKGGAGGSNVMLVHSEREAIKLVNQAFGKGFSLFNKLDNLRESYRKFKNGKDSLISVFKSIYRIFILPENMRNMSYEKGYIYFQDFIPNNKTDFRLKVIGNKCWGFQRKVRENDFRASGSGNLIFDHQNIPKDMIKMAFEISEKLNLQCVAYDFILDSNGKPLLVEMCYGFGVDEQELNYGYWSPDLTWNKSSFDPRFLILENLIKGIDK